jgi:hypothetical protein
MKTSRFIIAGISGAIALFLLGWLIYGIILMDFMNAHSPITKEVMSKVYRPMEEMLWLPLIISNLALSFLITTVYQWSKFSSIGGGALTGAVIALLMGISIDFSFFSMTYLYSKTNILTDIIAGMVMMTIAGIVISLIIKKEPGTSN